MATSKEKLQIIVDAQGIAKTKAQLKGMDKASGGVTKSFGAMAIGIAGATAALYAMGKATSFAIRVGKEFEQGMANVKAISGATGAEFKALEANARKLGASTKFTATEVSGLQTEFAKLGFTSSEINKVTEGTLALAAATGSDLATSAAVAGATLRGFGLDTMETGRVTDVMAKSFSSSALDMQKFSDSMTYVAPVAKMAGFSIEGTTAIMGQLANAGIDGSMAGTALRRIFLELSNSSSKLSKRLGGSVTSVDELIPALQKLNAEGVTTAEMKDLVGQRAISAFSILLDGSEDVDTLAESLRNAGGAAQEMADIQLDTLEGKMTIMKSATEGLGIALFDHLAPGLNKVVEGMTRLIGSMTEWLAIPASAKLEDEAQKVNNLSTAIQMAEVGSENRNRLVIELNSIQPDLLKGLSDEEIAQGKLTERLKEYNTQQTLKIALIKADEETLKLAEKKAEVDVKVADSTMAVTDAMIDLADSMGHALDPQKSMAENYEILMNARDEMIEGMTREERWSDSGTKAINDSAQARMRLITAYTAGEPGVESYIDLLVRQEEMAGKLATAEEIQARKREILNEMYSQAPSTPSGSTEDGEPSAPSLGPSDDEMETALQLMVEYQTSLRDIKITAAEQELFDEEQKLLRSAEILEMSEARQTEITEDFAKKRLKLEKKIDAEQLAGKLKLFADLAGALSGLMGENREFAKAQGRLAQAEAVMNTYAGATKALAQGGIFGFIGAATIVAAGLANVQKIEDQIRSAATGADFVTSGPELMMVGDNPGGRESVKVTPLSSEPGPDAPQGGGQTINISLEGAVLSDDFVEEVLSEKIAEAIRRGTDFGIS